MQKSFDSYLNIQLIKREVENSVRTLADYSHLVDFCSNDYLGFANSQRLKVAIDIELSKIKHAKTGSTGSRLITGNSDYTVSVENYIAKYHNAEAGLIFNSGYDANIGLFSSVPQRSDTIIYDELIHASIRDGIRLSWADSYSFKHNDINDLQAKLKKAKGKVFVAVESVYSMDGDIAPLIEIANVCENNVACLIVDEAHSTGLYGEKGQGLVVQLGIANKVYARVHTFGKALGVHGAIVLGSEILRTYLINFARSFIYTTAIPPISIASIKAAYSLMEFNQEDQAHLQELIVYFIEQSKKIKGSYFLSENTPIQSLILPGNGFVKEIASNIRIKGYDVRAIMSPTVPKGKERLRICIHSFNTKEQIDELIYTLALEAVRNK
ncbi:MAG: pyridoxal phosphate-dependent aminotransferase family protein [Bacteroidota bacterium]